MKNYFYIWVDGLGKGRELIKSIDMNGITYTNKVTEALRINVSDKPRMIKLLSAYGIAEWVIESNTTFMLTTYAPKGTKYNFFSF